MKTKAIIFSAKEEVEVGELDVAAPGPHEIQVRTSYSTISAGTEGWMLRGLFTRATIPFPGVPGYQRSGVVTAIGSDVSGWTVGDRALALISRWGTASVAPILGGHVGIANVATDFAYHVPDQVDDIDASCGVVAQVGYNAAHRAIYKPRDWILVFGDGLIGQCAAQAARARGARVALVGHRRERLELAARYSADAVINGKSEDVVQAVQKIVGAPTVPVVLDSVQSVGSQMQYMELLQTDHGQIVYCGFAPGDHWADMGILQERGVTTHYVNAWTRDRMEASLALMATGQMRIRPLVTHLVPCTQGPEMYGMILEKKKAFLGIVLDWKSVG